MENFQNLFLSQSLNQQFNRIGTANDNKPVEVLRTLLNLFKE